MCRIIFGVRNDKEKREGAKLEIREILNKILNKEKGVSLSIFYFFLYSIARFFVLLIPFYFRPILFSIMNVENGSPICVCGEVMRNFHRNWLKISSVRK